MDSMTERAMPVPPLVDGERLSRVEFERRYEAMPDIKAELIGGVVHVASPTKAGHGRPHQLLSTCIGNYVAATPGVDASLETTVRLGDEDEPEPDISLFVVGGGCREDAQGYLAGPPELVAEVSLSSLSLDLNAKRRAYERHGCREYLVLAVPDAALRAFALEGATLRPRALDPDGVFRSQAFPGLWLDGPAILRLDRRRADEVVRAGLASPEHAAFVRALASRG